MRVLIAAGGTGGHVIPALAIADALKSAYAGEVRFIGTARGLEARLVPQAGYRLELITVGQLNRVSWAIRIKTIAALPSAILDCVRFMRNWRPQVVIGAGGYVSGPAMLAAIAMRIPTLAFEPNAAPGLANRLIGRHVSAAAVNFPPALAHFRHAVLTGIPVRAEFFALREKPAGSPPRLLVLGGSQGALALNQAVPRIAQRLLDSVPGLTILHQAGERHAGTTHAAYSACGAPADRWEVRAFLEDIAGQFAASDLILARSGASTVAELAAAGKPSLLAPFPRAADDHQRKNAEVLRAAGAAAMLLEEEMTGPALLNALVDLLSSPVRLQKMAACARAMGKSDAALRIAKMSADLASAGALGPESGE